MGSGQSITERPSTGVHLPWRRDRPAAGRTHAGVQRSDDPMDSTAPHSFKTSSTDNGCGSVAELGGNAVLTARSAVKPGSWLPRTTQSAPVSPAARTYAGSAKQRARGSPRSLPGATPTSPAQPLTPSAVGSKAGAPRSPRILQPAGVADLRRASSPPLLTTLPPPCARQSAACEQLPLVRAMALEPPHASVPADVERSADSGGSPPHSPAPLLTPPTQPLLPFSASARGLLALRRQSSRARLTASTTRRGGAASSPPASARTGDAPLTELKSMPAAVVLSRRRSIPVLMQRRQSTQELEGLRRTVKSVTADARDDDTTDGDEQSAAIVGRDSVALVETTWDAVGAASLTTQMVELTRQRRQCDGDSAQRSRSTVAGADTRCAAGGTPVPRPPASRMGSPAESSRPVVFSGDDEPTSGWSVGPSTAPREPFGRCSPEVVDGSGSGSWGSPRSALCVPVPPLWMNDSERSSFADDTPGPVETNSPSFGGFLQEQPIRTHSPRGALLGSPTWPREFLSPRRGSSFALDRRLPPLLRAAEEQQTCLSARQRRLHTAAAAAALEEGDPSLQQLSCCAVAGTVPSPSVGAKCSSTIGADADAALIVPERARAVRCAGSDEEPHAVSVLLNRPMSIEEFHSFQAPREDAACGLRALVPDPRDGRVDRRAALRCAGTVDLSPEALHAAVPLLIDDAHSQEEEMGERLGVNASESWAGAPGGTPPRVQPSVRESILKKQRSARSRPPSRPSSAGSHTSSPRSGRAKRVVSFAEE